jgi:hypothetical protein
MSSQNRADPALVPGPQASSRRFDEEISALFEEYRTLREEITQRVAARMQMIGFAGIISALLVASNHLSVRSPGLYVSVLVLIVAVVWVRGTNRAIQRIGRHLRVVEARINAMAAQAWGSPDDLLTWETAIQGRRQLVGGVPGWFGRLGGWYTP